MPRLLDLFSGAGGAGEGYRRAGFTVTGVDLTEHVYPPGDFIRADAMHLLADEAFLAGFDAIHASPPCQHFSTATHAEAKLRHADLLTPTLARLRSLGIPYVVENVEGARAHLDHPIRLCGSSFGLGVRRHRYFETSAVAWSLPCEHARQGRPIGVYGGHPQNDREYRRPNGQRRGAKANSVTEARTAMGMPWGDWREVAEAIPPDFTEWIGRQLLAAL